MYGAAVAGGALHDGPAGVMSVPTVPALPTMAGDLVPVTVVVDPASSPGVAWMRLVGWRAGKGAAGIGPVFQVPFSPKTGRLRLAVFLGGRGSWAKVGVVPLGRCPLPAAPVKRVDEVVQFQR